MIHQIGNDTAIEDALSGEISIRCELISYSTMFCGLTYLERYNLIRICCAKTFALEGRTFPAVNLIDGLVVFLSLWSNDSRMEFYECGQAMNALKHTRDFAFVDVGKNSDRSTTFLFICLISVIVKKSSSS